MGAKILCSNSTSTDVVTLLLYMFRFYSHNNTHTFLKNPLIPIVVVNLVMILK
jgi:hypothetical protein